MANVVDDKIPEGATTDVAAVNEVLKLAGSPPVNAELAQIEAESGIRMNPEPSTVQTQDSNITFTNQQGQQGQTNVIGEPVVPPSTTAPTEDEKNLGILAQLLKPNEPAPTVTNGTDAIQNAVAGTFTQEQVNDLIATKVAEETQKYEKLQSVLDEFQKNPYEFHAKYNPALIKQFDVDAYVNGELLKEFGEEFQLVPEDVAKYGTQSNKYLKRQFELGQQAESIKNTAQNTEQVSQQEIEKQKNELKSTIQKKYGVSDEATFNPIWDEIGGLNRDEIYDRLIQHSLILKDIERMKGNITKPVSRGYQTPGVTDIIGGKPAVDNSANGELGQFYAPDRLNGANIIR